MGRKMKSWYLSEKALPYWIILLVDSLILILAGLVATYICSGGLGLSHNFWRHVLAWVYAIPLFLIGMRLFHTYSGVIRYSSTVDFMRVMFSLITGTALLSLTKIFMPDSLIPILAETRWLTLVVMFFLALMSQWGIRITIKYMYDVFVRGNKRQRVFIYGAREGGIAIARTITTDGNMKYSLAGFVSVDGNLESKYLMGVKVRNNGPNLIQHMKDAGATVLMVSPLQAENFRENDALINQLIAEKIKIVVTPNPEEWDPTKDIEQRSLREVEVEDLLPRDKIQVDMQAIGEMLRGKRILITGAAGSIGSEMVRQVAKFAPAELILIDQAETPMHDIRLWMKNNYPDIPSETIVGSICNATQMENIFCQHNPEYVFHAAAYKHVPMMENNPAMAIQNNTYGTRIIADLAVKYGTKKFVMISTDKAVNPTNVMGCSKRICEIYCQSLNAHQSTTQFITTRFGNVLGSNGSVIPIFKEQIKKGGPVTVTHPDIIRFFMLIPEACQLVLEAGTMGKGGEIFVFDMGKPVRIADLAQRMIDLSGAEGVRVEYTGLRDGEKLYEEVLNDAELTKPTHHPKIKIAAVREYDYEQALNNEEELLKLSYTYDDMAIVKKMKEIVPEYKSQHSKYEALDK